MSDAQELIRYYRLEEEGSEEWARAFARELRRNAQVAAVAAFALQRQGITIAGVVADDDDREEFLEASAAGFAHQNGLKFVEDRDELAQHLNRSIDELEEEEARGQS